MRETAPATTPSSNLPDVVVDEQTEWLDAELLDADIGPPPSRCPKHLNRPADGACGPCGDWRRHREEWTHTLAGQAWLLKNETTKHRIQRQAKVDGRSCLGSAAATAAAFDRLFARQLPNNRTADPISAGMEAEPDRYGLVVRGAATGRGRLSAAAVEVRESDEQLAALLGGAFRTA